MTEMSPLLPLEGGFNLRDMGGYATGDGRRVKRGMLFRSGMMSLLTEADEAHLAGLGIATVCDFRRPGERRRDPTRWCEPAGTLYWTRDHDASSGVLGELLRGALPTADSVRASMIIVYRDLLVEHAPSYRFLFERLAGGHVPLLFNCSAGKDRTGVAAALILSALGVPRDTIYEDYLLTNRYADFSRIIGREPSDQYRDVDAAVMAPLLAADTDYLDAAFESIDRDHGGMDAYLGSIGVDDGVKTTLRGLLLD
ncbi:tyrosine-protein phosphatase [Rhizorhabdus dicambivorans]|uniref:Protein-tyrosine-phosphatase n=1 Tax=Rhizorhabdus dicambivorans TaxID=1850238 RepID=A0A2A4G1U0_9SPHN|nr:tyrosine-protein phosphatase [Rhizorhabdus dicambivorans]ATE66766.1 protein-tyrosine-phosphatase [Rhizorhabdus dicambivorans]PCE43747.1 protein-tyrosine-phosphatase [Rhizorhabdus dicambivorans]